MPQDEVARQPRAIAGSLAGRATHRTDGGGRRLHERSPCSRVAGHLSYCRRE
jgi:hypothetical protein